MQNENEEHKANEPVAEYNNRIVNTTFADLEERDREHTRKMAHNQRMEYLQG
jgi:hypothetical protein